MSTSFSFRVSLKSYFLLVIMFLFDLVASYYLLFKVEDGLSFIIIFCFLALLIYSLISHIMKMFFCKLRIIDDNVLFYDHSDFYEYEISLACITNSYIKISKTSKAKIIELVICFLYDNQSITKAFSVYNLNDMEYFIKYLNCTKKSGHEGYVLVKMKNRLILSFYFIALVYLFGLFIFILLKPIIANDRYLIRFLG